MHSSLNLASSLLALFLSFMLCIPADARQQRSYAAKAEFKRQHPCPANGERRGPCPGYVIDHVQALKRGGADRPENMQWQTIEEAKQKDKWE